MTTDYLTPILEANGAFFAFSQSQFDEQKKEGVIYVSMGAGLICPKENADKLHEEVKRNSKKAIKAEIKKKGAKAIIRHEYFNHECQISMSTENAENALKRYIEIAPKEFTKVLISETFKECFNEAIEKDFF